MNWWKKRSLTQKLCFSGFPFLIGSIVNFFSFLHLQKADSDEDSKQAMQMIETVGLAEVQMLKMSESLLKALVESDPEEALKRLAQKAEADVSYNRYATDLRKISEKFPEIQVINDRMIVFDNTILNPAEDQVGEAIRSANSEAQAIYRRVYLPQRQIQDEDFLKMKEEIKKRAIEILEVHSENRMQQINFSIIVLVLAQVFGVGIQLWMLLGSVRAMEGVCQNLNHFAENLVQSVNQMNDQSNLLTQSMTEQATSLNETSASIEEMNAMVLRNSENAKKSADNSSDSQKAAEQGQQVMEEVIQSMDSIRNSNQQIMEQVKDNHREINQLVSVIREIESKTKVINDIVFQTKLLSFNASVEAARAGEHGKGFSVVAEEVGNLAAMSGKASQEIASMLEESIKKVETLLAETQSKIESLITRGGERVQAGVQVAEKGSEILRSIVSNITDVAKMAGEISTASRDQAQGIQEITQAIHRIHQTTQKTSSVSQETTSTAQAIQELSASQKQAISQLQGTLLGEKNQLEAA